MSGGALLHVTFHLEKEAQLHPVDDVITFTAPDDSGHFTCEI
ncbi:hypothetical protein [Corynebacterium variabile]|nr:hypothetical protein [Corynebacterium variabile]